MPAAQPTGECRLLSSKDRQAIEEHLQQMEGPVRLVHFTQNGNGTSCADARRLLEEVERLSEHVSLEVVDLQAHPASAAWYRIERAPATVVASAKDYGIRIYGLPAGYEFAVLLETILLVSRGRATLDPQVRSALAQLASPVHLQTFSTPTCPYCPGMAILAHKMAIESDWVRADTLNAAEFPDLVRAYSIRSVPKTVINDEIAVGGCVPAEALAAAILRTAAAQKQPADHR